MPLAPPDAPPPEPGEPVADAELAGLRVGGHFNPDLASHASNPLGAGIYPGPGPPRRGGLEGDHRRGGRRERRRAGALTSGPGHPVSPARAAAADVLARVFAADAFASAALDAETPAARASRATRARHGARLRRAPHRRLPDERLAARADAIDAKDPRRPERTA